MPSSDHFTVKGNSPYKQKNGIFEVEFAITEAKPTDEQIAQKSFLPLWREKSHLNIKNGEFEVTLALNQIHYLKKFLHSQAFGL